MVAAQGSIGGVPFAIVGLGSNVGSREAFLRLALRSIEADRELAVAHISSPYLTPPLGPPQPHFLNAAVRIETEIEPHALLARLASIERHLGRTREIRWGPRTIDLDFLYWQGGEVNAPDLIVPHPGLRDRAFALAPLLEIAPELAPLYARDLERRGAPERRAWTSALRDENAIEVRALDDLDALAIALSTALGDAPGQSSVLAASSPEELVESCTRPGLAGSVAIAGLWQVCLNLDPNRKNRPDRVTLGALGGGRCLLSLR
jgi:2-amino-4-hydroxy-6-hydroxymethyldihydropteridine diphosphokinase